MGGWAAPYGITLVFDALSGLMLAAAALVALGTLVHGFGSLSPRTERRYFHPLVNFMMFGVNLSFLTGDLFNLFVAFEIMLMASYGLLVIGGGRDQLRHAYKYVVLNLLASAVFVIAAGMAYGMFGTLNMADLSRITTQFAAAGELPAGFTALGVLFLFVFTLKAGVFPLWFWLPDTYPTCPISITALFGGVLTKVGLYAIARTFPLIFFAGPDADRVLVPILAMGAAMTMLVGVLGALRYSGLRRVLCLMLIVGVGYSLLGITVHSAGGLSGAAFYMAQSMIVMAALFLCCGMIERAVGTDETGR
ncbi:MAG: proton-conducting transporter membrane subunit, partial [Planctomycetota bacterium]